TGEAIAKDDGVVIAGNVFKVSRQGEIDEVGRVFLVNHFLFGLSDFERVDHDRIRKHHILIGEVLSKGNGSTQYSEPQTKSLPHVCSSVKASWRIATVSLPRSRRR